MKFTLLDRIIFRMTARRWNRLINLVLLSHYEGGRLSSTRLHALTAEFDPTQDPAYRRIRGGKLYGRNRLARAA